MAQFLTESYYAWKEALRYKKMREKKKSKEIFEAYHLTYTL